jgi:iron complex transport system permease protein
MDRKQYSLIYNIIILLILLIISIFISLSIGEINFTIGEIINTLQTKTGIEYTIIHNIRIPRILLGLSIGGALSLSGVILQGIYRNPLVEPYTLGISGGAALGVSIAIVLGLNVLNTYILPLFGFAGSILIISILYILTSTNRIFNINKMLLIGVMISFIASAIMMFLMSITSVENLHSIIFWTMGSLDETNPILIKISIYSSIIGLISTYIFATPLNALRLGKNKAKHLGINTDTSIKILFIIASLLTGISVSIVGIIGFVGLIIPHIIRLIVGNDYRHLLITSFLGGSIFIIICDIIARKIIAPNELPIGVITGIIGGIIFIIVVGKSKYNIQ